MRNQRLLSLVLALCVLGYCDLGSGAVAVFDDLASQVIFNTGNSPALAGFTPGDCPDCLFDITNNTGLVWTDFHLDLVVAQGPNGTFGFIDAAAGGYDGMGYEGPGVGTFSDFFHSLDIVDLNVPNGGVLSFTVDIDHFEFQGTLDVVAFPTVFVPVADFDGDGLLGLVDIDLLTDEVLKLTNTPRFDLNRDSRVDSADRVVWVEQIRKTYFGDSNLDGEFNSRDLVHVFQRGKYEDTADDNAGWGDGDWDGDRDFTSNDFLIAFQGGGYENGPRAAVSSVPEPNGFVRCGLGLLVALAGRKRLAIS